MRRFLMLIVLSAALVGSGLPLFAEPTTTTKGPVAEAGAAEKPAPAKAHKKHGGKKHKKEKTSKAGETSSPTASAEKAAK